MQMLLHISVAVSVLTEGGAFSTHILGEGRGRLYYQQITQKELLECWGIRFRHSQTFYP